MSLGLLVGASLSVLSQQDRLITEMLNLVEYDLSCSPLRSMRVQLV